MTQAPCPDFEPLLERFADGEGDSEESLRVREHLSACAPCRIGLRSITELNRRVAQSPPPPVPPNLEARIRRALRRADRPLRRWATPAAAAAVLLLAATAFLLRPSPAAAQSLPPAVVGGAHLHGRYLMGALSYVAGDPAELRDYFRRTLDDEVVLPSFDAVDCKGRCAAGCPCSVNPGPVSWIFYRRGISLIIVPHEPGLLAAPARRTREGRDYFVYDFHGATAVVRAAGPAACIWIARLPESDLLECILDTQEGRDAFSGATVSARAIACRACCGPKRGKPAYAPRVDRAPMEVMVIGRKGIDLAPYIREGQDL